MNAIGRSAKRRRPRGRAYVFAAAVACAATAASAPAAAAKVRPRHRMFDPDHSAVGVEAGLGVLGRTFAYADRGTPNLRDYSAWGVAAPYARLDVWPTFLIKKFPLDLGLVGGVATSAGLRSTIDGDRVPTSWTRWDLGVALRASIPYGSARLGVSVGRDRFAFGASDALAYELPQVDYTYVRVGADVRGRFGWAVVTSAIGYRFVPLGARDGTQVDTVNGRFPRSTAGGVDLQLGVALPLYYLTRDRGFRGVEVRTTFEWTRWFHSMHPQLGDEYVAGGALDHMFGVRFGVAWVF